MLDLVLIPRAKENEEKLVNVAFNAIANRDVLHHEVRNMDMNGETTSLSDHKGCSVIVDTKQLDINFKNLYPRD